MGARMQGGLVAGRFDSTGCAADIRFDGFSFRSSDPAILRLVETPPPYGARYLAVAPGTARVFAVDPAQPEARREAELSICVDPTTFDDKNCVRMPLVIRVVP
ncbi:MAG: hypothetical protein ACHP85_14575 [Burkholderiales bacterium]